MEITRREALRLGLFGGAALLFPLQRAAVGRADRPLRQLPEPFEAVLRRPPVLRPVRRTPTTDFYEITQRSARVEILPGVETGIWGYNGLFPGPTIMARRGRNVVVRHTNQLSRPTSVHLHGAYADGDNDGHPANLIQPGTSKTYVYPNNQNARFMWYHDHAQHTTASNVYHGLAGLYLLKDDFEDDLPLPEGQFDVPLVIQDRLFTEDGELLYPIAEGDGGTSNGVFGDVVLVNGRPWPRMPVAARTYRLRILNGSNARTYRLVLSTRRPFTVIATEGGLMRRPVTVRSLPITMAERYEIIVDFSEYPVGQRVILENLADDGPASRIMRFDVVRRAKDDSRVPPVLRPLSEQLDDTHLPADSSEAVRTRRFELERGGGEWTINGRTWDADRVDIRGREGEVEIWEFRSSSGGWSHPIHPHLLNFRILERDGRPPLSYERSWKDTVNLGPNHNSVRVLLRWPRVPVVGRAGPFARRFPIHCHNIEHEDHDMMVQFEVGARA